MLRLLTRPLIKPSPVFLRLSHRKMASADTPDFVCVLNIVLACRISHGFLTIEQNFVPTTGRNGSRGPKYH